MFKVDSAISIRLSRWIVGLLLVAFLKSFSLSAPRLTPQAIAVSANPAPVCSGATCTITFVFTGDYYQWTVPAGLSAITFDVQGAQGSNGGRTPGSGGRVTGTLSVTAGSTYYFYVGGQNGYNGGGAKSNWGAVGGGGSDIRTSVNSTYADRLVVAGGGGGSGSLSSGNGGAGGGLTGGSGGGRWIATGGTQSAGGAGGQRSGEPNGQPGTFGIGGRGKGSCSGGGGGGGGWYGGGGGQATAGGGGSSYVAHPGNSNTSTTPGLRTGNGTVAISY